MLSLETDVFAMVPAVVSPTTKTETFEVFVDELSQEERINPGSLVLISFWERIGRYSE